jgi:hypothetical protein
VGALLVLFCLGAAVTMAVSGKDEARSENADFDVVGAVVKSPSQLAPQAKASVPDQADAPFDLGSIRRKGAQKVQTSGLFQSKSWYTPPPPPPISSAAPASLAPPPPPSPPQIPYTYIGKLVDGHDVVLFLLKNDHEYTVRVNDVLDDAYRVDKITDKEVVLTYIPMNAQQTLQFSSGMSANPSADAGGAYPQTPSSPSSRP